MSKEVTEREFKAACLRCLLRGGITDTESEVIAAYCLQSRVIIERAATIEEENELAAARRDNRIKEFLERSYETDEPTTSNKYDKAVYLKAVKSGFDAVKDWFKNRFGGKDITVVWFGDVKPNLNPNANPNGNK